MRGLARTARAGPRLRDPDLPPGFRPLHYAEAVRRGRHVFAEKPVATDPAGCRAIRATAEEARQKGLSAVVGLNYRHDLGVMETVKRIHDGAVGRIIGGTMHRMGGGLWHRGSIRVDAHGVPVPQLVLLLLARRRPDRRDGRFTRSTS